MQWLKFKNTRIHTQIHSNDSSASHIITYLSFLWLPVQFTKIQFFMLKMWWQATSRNACALYQNVTITKYLNERHSLVTKSIVVFIIALRYIGVIDAIMCWLSVQRETHSIGVASMVNGTLEEKKICVNSLTLNTNKRTHLHFNRLLCHERVLVFMDALCQFFCLCKIILY